MADNNTHGRLESWRWGLPRRGFDLIAAVRNELPLSRGPASVPIDRLKLEALLEWAAVAEEEETWGRHIDILAIETRTPVPENLKTP